MPNIKTDSSKKESAREDSIAALPGLGPKSQAMLEAAGIDNLIELRKLGAVDAFLRVKKTGAKVSLNLLWGLESALSGEHWQQVARNRRLELLVQLEDAEKQSQV